jgi:hypothetical protein
VQTTAVRVRNAPEGVPCATVRSKVAFFFSPRQRSKMHLHILLCGDDSLAMIPPLFLFFCIPSRLV